jgi:hypothetical protein
LTSVIQGDGIPSRSVELSSLKRVLSNGPHKKIQRSIWMLFTPVDVLPRVDLRADTTDNVQCFKLKTSVSANLVSGGVRNDTPLQPPVFQQLM